MSYRVRFTRQAEKDIKRLSPKLRDKLKAILLNRLAADPYSGKALLGSLKGCYSARLTFQDRVVYSIRDDELLLLVLRDRTHDGD